MRERRALETRGAAAGLFGGASSQTTSFKTLGRNCSFTSIGCRSTERLGRALLKMSALRRKYDREVKVAVTRAVVDSGRLKSGIIRLSSRRDFHPTAGAVNSEKEGSEA